MRYEEFKRQLGKAGLTAREFADLVGLNRNSVSNFAIADVVPSHWAIVALLMGEMAEREIDFRDTLSRIEITPNKPRGAGAGTFGGNKK